MNKESEKGEVWKLLQKLKLEKYYETLVEFGLNSLKSLKLLEAFKENKLLELGMNRKDVQIIIKSLEVS